ncbi:MAG: autotransporter-associated beta strand repeat-containing protein [Chthoniobacteraceae bacterium]
MKKHPHLRSSRRTAALILVGSVAALLVPRLSAQTTITYTNGQTDATAYSTSAPNDPTTLSLASGAATQSGILSGNGAVIINAGTGTLTLSAANTVSGTTTVSAGTLALGNVNALQNSTLNTGVSGTQAVTFTVAGTNTYNLGGLTGADAIANGGNTISVGANNADTTYSGGVSGTGGLTKVGTGTLTLSNVNSRSGVTTLREGTLSTNSVKNFGGSASNAAANLVFDGGTLRYTGSTASSTSRDFTINAGKTATFDISINLSWHGASVATTGALTKTGAGTLTLSGANLHTGATTISAGVLVSANEGALSTTSSVAVNSTGTLAVKYGGASDYTQAQVGTLLGKTTFGATTAAFGFDTTNAVGAATYGSVLSMAAGVTKLGAGTLVLDQANTYTGATTVSAGTLALGNVNALQNSTLDTGASGAQAVTFTVAGTNTYNVGGLKGADDLAIGANTLSVGANGQNTSYTGVLSGLNGVLNKVGAGTLTLSSAPLHTGGTTVNAGTLLLSGATTCPPPGRCR